MVARSLSRRTALRGLALLPTLPMLWSGPAHASTGRWREGAQLPVRLQEIYPAVLDGRIYVAGGISPDGGILDILASWDGMAAAWTLHPGMTRPRHHVACLPWGGRLICAGGFVSQGRGLWRCVDDVTIFDPDSEGWSEGPALPGPQAEAVALAHAGNLHLIGGREPIEIGGASYENNRDSARHLVLAAGEATWREAAPLPSPRNSAAGAVIDGHLHVVGGRLVTGGNLSEHLRYDPRGDRWERLAPLPLPVEGRPGSGGLAAAALGGRLFAFGGEWFEDGGGVYSEHWMWGPDDRWESLGAMNLPRHGLGAVTLGDHIVTLGGATGRGVAGTSAVVDIFIP